jgi:hypothetical protein
MQPIDRVAFAAYGSARHNIGNPESSFRYLNREMSSGRQMARPDQGSVADIDSWLTTECSYDFDETRRPTHPRTSPWMEAALLVPVATP